MKTCVLLSTYNGSEFIREQLESLLTQTSTPSHLIIRDDGSTDDTIEICKTVLSGGEIEVQYHLAENVGPERSFFELMRHGLTIDADAFFFCDQDDIWEADKIERFLAAFSSESEPQLVLSQFRLVDRDNHHLSVSSPPREISFRNALIQNIVTGCVCAVNRSCLQLAGLNEPEEKVLHDRWLYLVASSFGTIHFIDYPSTRYRQHGGNVVGANSQSVELYIKRLKRFFGSAHEARLASVRCFRRRFASSLAPGHLQAIDKYLSSESRWRGRLALLFDRRFRRQKLVDDIIWRVAILCGKG